MSHLTMTPEQIRAHQERIGRQLAEAERAGPAGDQPGTAAVKRYELLLPPPVSANRYWRSYVPKGQRRAIVVLSEEAKEYKLKVRAIAIDAGITRPITGRVAIEADLYPMRPLDWGKRAARDPFGWDDTVLCIDLDNAPKIAIDAIKGSVIEDDKFVWDLHFRRMEPDGEARMLMRIVKIVAPASPQRALEWVDS